MPFAIGGAVLGSVAGAATSSLLSPGSSGGSGGSGGGPSYYVPTGLPYADTTWQSLLGSELGQYQNTGLNQYGLQSLYAGLNANNQYGPGYQNAANAAGANYGGLAGTLANQSGYNFGMQQALNQAGGQVYQTALDPQSALYNRSVQQLQDQTGATNSMYGLGNSAAGAGVANQALSNFNIDWQNQQLQRQLQGIQGLTGAAQAAGAYGQLGTAQAEAMPGYSLMAGQIPYQTAQSIGATPGQVAGQYGSFLNSNVYGPAMAIQNQTIPYMNYGQGSQAIPYQNQQAGAGAAGALVSQGINAIGSNPQVQSTLGNAFSNYFNPASGSFSGGDFGGAFNSSPYYSGGGNSYGFTT